MNILQQLVQIILLQRRPQDLDFDYTAAIFYAVAAAGLTYITSAQAGVFSQPLAISLIQTVSQALILFLFLQIASRTQRFVQTCTAMFGVSAILSVIIWPIAQVPGLSILTPFLIAWSVVITIIILRDAFDASIIKALIIMVGMGALSVFILMLLVPTYATEAQQIFNTETASG